MRIRRILSLLSVLLIAVSLFTACSKDPALDPEEGLAQLRMPETGDPVAVIETNRGTVYVLLFPEFAPIAVENFSRLANDGYYDGLSFHKIITGFCIQTGDPTETGSGGESIWQSGFDNEYHDELHHYFGAVGMANNGDGTNGSQFYIITGGVADAALQSEMLDAGFDPAVVAAYEEHGGQPKLDYRYTVFGQVYDGMDVLLEIDGLKVDDLYRPKKDAVVETVRVISYEEPA